VPCWTKWESIPSDLGTKGLFDHDQSGNCIFVPSVNGLFELSGKVSLDQVTKCLIGPSDEVSNWTKCQSVVGPSVKVSHWTKWKIVSSDQGARCPKCLLEPC